MIGVQRLISHTLLFMVCMPGVAAPQAGSFAGRVSGPKGEPLAGATVTLSRVDDGLRIGTALSGADGKYRLTGVDYGRYHLSAAMAGYTQSAIETVTLAGDVDFSLQPDSPGMGAADGFVGNDNDPLAFHASGVEGATAPGGYSAAASADDAAAVVTQVSRMEESGISLEPSAAKILDCNREGDLIRAAHSHPASFDANQQLGIFYFQHGDMKQSIAFLELASAIQPLAMDDARWLALAYIRSNQSSKAIASMQATVRRTPSDPAPLRHLAQVYEATDDRPRAVAQYLAAARLNSEAENLFACGMGLVSLGAVEPALELFSAATGSHPSSARLWTGLGIAQSLSNRRAESARSLLRAADLDPRFMPAWFFLAALPGSPTAIDDEIRRRLAALVVANSDSAEAHYDYALALWKHWRPNPSLPLSGQIEAQLGFAIARDPAFPAAHFQLGTVYEQVGEYRQAAIELEQAVQLDPDNAAAHYRLAQAYRRTNQAALANRELAKFKTMHSGQPNEDDATEVSWHAYTAQRTQPIQPTASCRGVP